MKKWTSFSETSSSSSLILISSSLMTIWERSLFSSMLVWWICWEVTKPEDGPNGMSSNSIRMTSLSLFSWLQNGHQSPQILNFSLSSLIISTLTTMGISLTSNILSLLDPAFWQEQTHNLMPSSTPSSPNPNRSNLQPKRRWWQWKRRRQKSSTPRFGTNSEHFTTRTWSLECKHCCQSKSRSWSSRYWNRWVCKSTSTSFGISSGLIKMVMGRFPSSSL